MLDCMLEPMDNGPIYSERGGLNRSIKRINRALRTLIKAKKLVGNDKIQPRSRPHDRDEHSMHLPPAYARVQLNQTLICTPLYRYARQA